jgi:hypothetical protein
MVFLLTMISQSLIGFEPYHAVFFGLNWLFILLHLGLSARFMLQRRAGGKRDREMSYYIGGNILRDAAPE